jgi:hypothetical protein
MHVLTSPIEHGDQYSTVVELMSACATVKKTVTASRYFKLQFDYISLIAWFRDIAFGPPDDAACAHCHDARALARCRVMAAPWRGAPP